MHYLPVPLGFCEQLLPIHEQKRAHGLIKVGSKNTSAAGLSNCFTCFWFFFHLEETFTKSFSNVPSPQALENYPNSFLHKVKVMHWSCCIRYLYQARINVYIPSAFSL